MIDPTGYCRDIEAYLCRKNDGHLIRIVGPAFEQVSGWARDGIPLNVVCAGIDRYFERYYRRGPRRRPVRVEFCEADVRDAFDEWRRAVGLQATSGGTAEEPAPARRVPLATHVERAVARLTALRAGPQAAGLDAALERAARALDALQAPARSARGHAREQLLDQLAAIDRELGTSAAHALTAAERDALERQAREAVAPFRDRMPVEAYQKACAAALDRAVRAHFGLPTVSLE